MTQYAELPEWSVECREHIAHDIWPRTAGFWAVCAYMAIYVIRPWETLVPGLASLSFERVAYALILLTVMGSPGLNWRWDGPIKGVLTFAAALCISAIAGYDPALAWSAPDGMYVYLTKLLAVLLIISVVRSPNDLFMLFTMAVVVIYAFAAKSIWEYAIHGAGRWSMGVLRLRGINDTFGHANALSALLVPTLPWWLFLWRCRLALTACWTAWMTRLFTLFLYLSAVTFTACVLLSGSRAGFAALVAFGALSWVTASGGRLKLGLWGVTFALIAWSTLDAEHEQRIRSLWDEKAAVAGGQESKEGRTYAFQAGLRMIKQHPLTGVGIGNFMEYRARFDDGAAVAAHSIPAQLLGETGLVGTTAFIYLLWSLYRATRQLNFRARASDDEVDRMLSELGTAIRHSIYLLLIIGTANHSAYLFSWIWIAALLSCALAISDEHARPDFTLTEL